MSECPRCHEPHEAEHYGPCPSCVEQLRSRAESGEIYGRWRAGLTRTVPK